MSEIQTLRSIINDSLDIMQSELNSANLPEFWVSIPEAHPADAPDFLPSPRLCESRRILLAALRMMATAIQPPSEKIIEAGWCHQEASALTTAIKYNVAQDLCDASVDQEKGVEGAILASKYGLLPDEFTRVMRALAAKHYIRETSEGCFAANRVSVALTPPNAAPRAAAYNGGFGLAVATRLTDSLDIHEHRTAAQLAHGYDTDLFTFLTTNSKYFNIFTAAMTGTYDATHASLMADYPWAELSSDTVVIDIGGGEGGLGMAIVKAFPHLKVINQDRPEVQAPAYKNWQSHIPDIFESGRIAFEPHNFFDPEPRKGAQYLCIIHDWPYDDCVAILNCLKSAMVPSSRLLIIENVVYPPVSPSAYVPFMLGSVNNRQAFKKADTPWPLPNGSQVLELTHDYEMLSNFKAKERTPSEWRSLLGDVGMKMVKIWPTRTPFSIVEAALE
ncbi:S-adenosyl-L-methionine-dependent methyltransferase [Calocera cornea HHB12733]|uniref:S-adenosyl-L-methionine-dependent methyltransferase n=1 Tax=Calocera cornea HHB12733 TaxID=1353952 RepID=A0A165F607_9BASI|nr:S-adenosyl-L-methionine-dependent methyltransferase [Calocera cornea HHB12733]